MEHTSGGGNDTTITLLDQKTELLEIPAYRFQLSGKKQEELLSRASTSLSLSEINEQEKNIPA